MSEQMHIDGEAISFSPGQTILEAALADGIKLPHLCAHPQLPPHGSCRVCTVKVNGHFVTSCTVRAEAGMRVESDTPEVLSLRRGLTQMLFVEGNHFCPSCEKSGDCKLQEVGYQLEVLHPQFAQLFPNRPVDASHPQVVLDFNRCILCELCVRASKDIDGKNVFSFSGRGLEKHLIVNAESGRLADTDLSLDDVAVEVCPVGVFLKKGQGFVAPIGSRRLDATSASGDE